MWFGPTNFSFFWFNSVEAQWTAPTKADSCPKVFTAAMPPSVVYLNYELKSVCSNTVLEEFMKSEQMKCNYFCTNNVNWEKYFPLLRLLVLHIAQEEIYLYIYMMTIKSSWKALKFRNSYFYSYLNNWSRGLLSHVMNCILVSQPVRAFHGIIKMPSPVILFHISQSSIDASLKINHTHFFTCNSFWLPLTWRCVLSATEVYHEHEIYIFCRWEVDWLRCLTADYHHFPSHCSGLQVKAHMLESSSSQKSPIAWECFPWSSILP